jgi:ATP-dependent helicase/nuclease subunit A
MDGSTNGGAVAAKDARAIASWIARRMATDDRRAGDVLILTPGKKHLAHYARALAARNIPASTTGAPLPREHELQELLVVLGAIADPENAVAVAAALEGLFFGLSPADLWRGMRARLRFAITHPPASEAQPMGVALAQLHDWWTYSQRHPADVLLDRIINDTGLLYHAASSELGEARAGALLHLVSVVRASSADGAIGLADVMARIEFLLASDAPDAPLRPGRTDVVRVMNLHKAKGLEADVVILAAPVDRTVHEPTIHVTRDSTGKPTGGLLVRSGKTVLAQPPGWDAMQQEEERFAAAERERLLYVAATRAKRELLVSQCVTKLKKGPKPDASAWRALATVLEEHSLVLPLSEMEGAPPPGRRTADVSGLALRAASDAAVARVQAAAAPSFTMATVTSRAKDGNPEPGFMQPSRVAAGAAEGAGVEWGRAVHEALEGLGRGRRGAALDAYVAAVARAHMLDDTASAALALVVAQVQESVEWKQLTATGPVMIEMPVMCCVRAGDMDQLTEGVVDAAALGRDGWLVVDWKSDVVDDAEWERRRPAYERQVALYAEMLSASSGRPARGVVKRVRA